MGGSIRSRRNHTLLCFLTVYGIHGVIFHVLSSPPVFVSSVILKPVILRIISETKTSANLSSHDQKSHGIDAIKNNISVNLSVTHYTYAMEKNVDIQIKNASDPPETKDLLCEYVLSELEKKSLKVSGVTKDSCLSFEWISNSLNSTSSSATPSTLSVIVSLFSDVQMLKMFSPSAWGVFIGCLVFFFTSTDHSMEVSPRCSENI